MVIKMGYMGKNGIEMWRYLDCLGDVRIVSCFHERYFCTRKTHMDKDPWVEFQHRTEKTIDGNTTWDDKEVEIGSIWFDTSILPEYEHGLMKWLTVVFYIDKENREHSFACLADSVFVMNDSGKTIDKY